MTDSGNGSGEAGPAHRAHRKEKGEAVSAEQTRKPTNQRVENQTVFKSGIAFVGQL